MIQGTTLPTHQKYVSRGPEWQRANRFLGVLRADHVEVRKDAHTWLARLISVCIASGVCTFAVIAMRQLLLVSSAEFERKKARRTSGCTRSRGVVVLL